MRQREKPLIRGNFFFLHFYAYQSNSRRLRHTFFFVENFEHSAAKGNDYEVEHLLSLEGTSRGDNSMPQPYFLTKSTCLYSLIATLYNIQFQLKNDVVSKLLQT